MKMTQELPGAYQPVSWLQVSGVGWFGEQFLDLVMTAHCRSPSALKKRHEPGNRPGLHLSRLSHSYVKCDLMDPNC